MRVLVVTSPGIGHIFPTITTAWALRAAGHEVLFASGGYYEAVARAGLPVVDTAPGVDFAAVFGGFFARRPEFAELTRDLGRGAPLAAELFAEVSSHFVAGTVELAGRWEPDLVLYTPLQGAGPLAAAVTGVPAVSHAIGLGDTAGLERHLSQQMAGHYDNYGAEPRDAVANLNTTPPSMRGAETASDGADWEMGYVPFNGGAVLPDWLLRRAVRHRVTVTFGTVFGQFGIGGLAPLVTAAADCDADFVLALGGADLSQLETLPDNVHPVGWVPLGALLEASDAVIHHGGAGTTLTTLSAGVPQLIAPQGADHFVNAEIAGKRGVATVAGLAEIDATRVGELLADTALRAAAAEVSAEMTRQPSPAALVPRLESLV